MKNTKTKLISSVTVLLICFAMLIGSTFAWFTDNASTGVNKIQAGNLDIEAYYQNTTLSAVEGQTTTYSLPAGSPRGNSIIFENTTNPLDGAELIDDNVKFEPGYVGAKLVTVKNVGNLAAKIKLQFAVKDNGLADQIWYDFMQVTKNANNENEVTGNYDPNRLLTGIANFARGYEKSLSAGNEYKFIFMYGMKETAGNEYQGKSVDLSVTVLAKQMTEEYDSFDNHYDDGATYDSTIWDSSINQPATKIENGQTVYEINTAAELAWVAEAVNNGTNTFANETVKLMKDINLANIPWNPIGINNGNDRWFKGTFDGNDKSISNIYCTNPNYGGLFGYIGTGTITNTTIKNLNLNNVNLTNGANVGECAGGALIGWIENHIEGSTITIENVTVTGIKANGYKYTGGLVGYQSAKPLTISNVSIVGTETMNTINSSFYKDNDYKGHVGGLVGYYSTGTATDVTLKDIAITRSGDALSNRAGVFVGTLLADANITSATVSYVTLLGTPVTSTSNMAGPDASHGTTTGITAQ